jgi:hypothetical protein
MEPSDEYVPFYPKLSDEDLRRMSQELKEWEEQDRRILSAEKKKRHTSQLPARSSGCPGDADNAPCREGSTNTQPGALSPEPAGIAHRDPSGPAGPPRGYCAARLHDGSLCGAQASIQAAGGLLCEAHARRLAGAYDSFRRFRVTPEEEEGGLIQALAALPGYAQVRLLTCLGELGLPETRPDASGSAAEQCADILLRLSAGLISRRWRGGDPTLPL